ncbi:AraC family transcriptional regulator [Kineothrix alysoides]|uniref:AraC family transcriptional regulator n=1 Tax=Kineothrix alysoides TaxID=1469948 RepID=A0A4R1QWP4_9FIRM|nr:helix-turn-helix transcriptional regulator [Kineothrix alysoides]TCL57285.1 AraC family transcriptional regulator [Kineothrix alysoides]
MLIHSDNAFNISPPHILLNEYVFFYNVVFPTPGMFVANYTLMPDACGTLSLTFNGRNIQAELWGASVTPTLLGTEPNKYHVMLLIQLSPYGLYQITHCHQGELADKRLLLENVDKRLFTSLCQAFETADNISGLFSMCDKILYSRMEHCIVSEALLSATRKISDNQGQILVSELAKKVGYSERQLNRLFLMQIGMNVKSYTRLVRFNYVLSNIQKSPYFFSELSQQAGYFDQPHFDKDFKAISGVTPQNYLKTMSDFYYDASEVSPMLSLRRDSI